MEGERSEPSNDELKRALLDMVYQFAYERGNDGEQLTTGGLSPLEHAFMVLGLPDPISKREFIGRYPY